MKKKNLKLSLGKKSISNLHSLEITGGILDNTAVSHCETKCKIVCSSACPNNTLITCPPKPSDICISETPLLCP
ncbi:hypothetical protein [Kordia sp.]|uniref:hypothetical protein n=1 Tax=Kordia sp. TaxID=1965332 RepID=UPI003D290D10